MAAKRKPLPGHKFQGVQRWFEARCECGWRGVMHATQGAMAEAVAEWHDHIRRCEPTDAALLMDGNSWYSTDQIAEIKTRRRGA